MLLTAVVSLAAADVLPTASMGVGASLFHCSDAVPDDRTYSHLLLGPTLSLGVEVDIGPSRVVLGANSSPGLGYRCQDSVFAHVLAADAMWLFSAGSVSLGPHLSVGAIRYLSAGLQVEGRTRLGNVTLAPGARVSVVAAGILEAHILLRAVLERPSASDAR